MGEVPAYTCMHDMGFTLLQRPDHAVGFMVHEVCKATVGFLIAPDENTL